MPLIKSKSGPAFKANLKAELAAGKPQKQALAIAYSVKRRAKRARGGMADGGDPNYSIDPGPSSPAQAPAWPGDAGVSAAPQGDEHSHALQDVNRMFIDREIAKLHKRGIAPGDLTPEESADRFNRLHGAASFMGLAGGALPAATTLGTEFYGQHADDPNWKEALANQAVPMAASMAAGPAAGLGIRYAPRATAAVLGTLGLSSSGTEAGDAGVADPLAAAEQAERDAVDRKVGTKPIETDYNDTAQYRRDLRNYNKRVQENAPEYQKITDKYLPLKQAAHDLPPETLKEMNMTLDQWRQLSTDRQNQLIVQNQAKNQQDAAKAAYEALPLRSQHPEAGLGGYGAAVALGAIPYVNRWRAQGTSNAFNRSALDNVNAAKDLMAKAAAEGRDLSQGELLAIKNAVTQAETQAKLAPTKGVPYPPKSWTEMFKDIPSDVKHAVLPSVAGAGLAMFPEEFDATYWKRGTPYANEAMNRLFSWDTAQTGLAGLASPLLAREISNLIPVRKHAPFPEEVVNPFVKTYKSPVNAQLKALSQGSKEPPGVPVGQLPSASPTIAAPIAAPEMPAALPAEAAGTATSPPTPSLPEAVTPASPKRTRTRSSKSAKLPNWSETKAAGGRATGHGSPASQQSEHTRSGSPASTAQRSRQGSSSPSADAAPSLPRGLRRGYQTGGAPMPSGASSSRVSSPNYSGNPAPRQYATGGMPAPWWERRQAAEMTHSGPIMSAVPGRTDKINMNVKSGSYVLPAETVSHLGQSNSIAGLKIAGHMFGGRGNGLPKPPAPMMKFATGGSAHDGKPVPIIAAGGEYVIEPDQVARIGGGDVDRGHKILDAFVLHMRKQHLKTIAALKPPAKD